MKNPEFDDVLLCNICGCPIQKGTVYGEYNETNVCRDCLMEKVNNLSDTELAELLGCTAKKA